MLHWGGALQVLGSSLDVEVDLFLTQIDHVAGEERLAVLLEVLLIGIQETIQPWEKLLGAMVGVENDGDTVSWGNSTNVIGPSNPTSNGSLLVAI